MRKFIRVLVTALTGYHKFLSPLLPPSCRFYPSCSVFAAQALRKHGIQKGTLLALRRLFRCHPGHPGGYDPVG